MTGNLANLVPILDQSLTNLKNLPIRPPIHQYRTYRRSSTDLSIFEMAPNIMLIQRQLANIFLPCPIQRQSMAGQASDVSHTIRPLHTSICGKHQSMMITNWHRIDTRYASPTEPIHRHNVKPASIRCQCGSSSRSI